MHTTTIPEQAHRVHSGPTFDIYQREQELFDGSYTTFEVARAHNAVKVFLVDREQQIIYLVHDEQPGVTRITLAGGIVEDGEDLLVSAEREVYEETTCVYKNIVPWFRIPYSHRIQGFTQYYIAWDLKFLDIEIQR